MVPNQENDNTDDADGLDAEDGVVVEDDGADGGDGGGAGDGAGDAVDEASLPDTIKNLLKKSRDDTRAAQRELRQFKAQLRDKSKNNGDGKDAPDLDAMVAKKTDEVWKPRLVKSSARAAFATAGASGSRIDRLVKMLDLSELDVNDDGEVDGLDDQIEDIKSDFPELFGAGPVKRTNRRIDAAGGGSGGGDRRTASQRQADALLGKR